jgi:hypothetical protein
MPLPCATYRFVTPDPLHLVCVPVSVALFVNKKSRRFFMPTQQPTTPNKTQPDMKSGTIQQPGKPSQQPQQTPNPANKTGEAARPSDAKKPY